MLYSLCILGAGVTGLSLLLLLQEAGIHLSSVAIVDPHFDGGDLARKWGPVLSNTPWSKTVNAIRAACPERNVPDTFPPSSTTPLIELSHLLRKQAALALQGCTRVVGYATAASYEAGVWTVTYRTSGNILTLQTKALILATGSEPKGMSHPIPSIPLECALDQRRLAGYVRDGQRVILYGTMHSGTLIMRNLKSLGAYTTAVYKGEKPFVWDRDGAYDGIKEEAALIADAITRGEYADKLTLVPYGNTDILLNDLLDADWVIYAMGFQARREITMTVNGESRDITSYDGSTGALTDCPKAWGFGIAYPNRAPDGVHWDVSIAAFLAHMKTQMPSILGIVYAK